jgi:glycosyltransferase involved in cell wall biosynthesis
VGLETERQVLLLGTNLGGIPYLIGVDTFAPAGWVVEPNVVTLAAGLDRAHAEAANLRSAARERYLTTFSPDVVLRQLIDVYERVVSTRPRS